MTEEATTYDASHIEVLEGWKAVRKRPGMYVGSTGERGVRNMVFDVADRPVNDVLAGRARTVGITLLSDGGIRVADDGPGVDGAGLEDLLTRFQTGARSPEGRREVALSFCGVGPGVVNALSRRMTAEVRLDGVRRVQEYARGVAVTPLTEAGTANGTGTAIAFWPDPDIFGAAECSFDALVERFRDLAFLHRGLEVSLTDERGPGEPRSERFLFPGGVREFVRFLDGGTVDSVPADTIAFECEAPRMAGAMEVAFRWTGSHEERVRGFANGLPTLEGTHLEGFRAGLAAALTAYARAHREPTANDITLDRIGVGLTAVVSVKLDHPRFEGATWGVLANSTVRDCVRQGVREHLSRWLEEHPERAAALLDRMR
ncbi:DNA gyrase subunit B [Streptomyces sp. NPDC000983]|uniref:DNA gyrase subunit B n=1 Tax=Streptomyces sp. NPDC000983 TaxID=3154373 RepID=UPI00332F0D43